jgi:hypothetical protein
MWLYLNAVQKRRCIRSVEEVTALRERQKSHQCLHQQRAPDLSSHAFVTVPHRCFRPAIDETCKRVGVECFRVVGIEVGMSLVRISPCNSRTGIP